MSAEAPGVAPPAGTVRRWPLALVLVALLVAAIVVGNGAGSTKAAGQSPPDPAAIAGTGARSSAWYCPGPPPSSLLSKASERIFVSNLEPKPVDVAVTAFPTGGATFHRTSTAPAHGSLTVEPAGGLAAKGPLIIEPFASRVAVEATNAGPNVFASAPCASRASPEWHFASGTTLLGTEDWIVIFNPFGDDAVVDMSFYTKAGRQDPSALHGKTIPRHGRVAIPVQDYVRRTAFVAATITARTGRVVAQQTVLYGAVSNLSGETRSLGAPAPADEWVFPSGRTSPGGHRVIGIMNPTDRDARVDVQVAPTNNVLIEPETLPIPPQSVVNVQVGGCRSNAPATCVRVPQSVSYTVVVRAHGNVPVVAEDLATRVGQSGSGASAALGGAVPSTTWVFPRSRVTPELVSQLDILSVANATAHASVTFDVRGKEVAPANLQHIEVKPGVPVTVRLDTRPELRNTDAAVVVRADRPLFVERSIVRSDGFSRTMGIPER